jgi:RNA polymerase sigma-70 factor (ECF subfamily)
MNEINFDEIKRLQEGQKTVFNRIITIYGKFVAGLCLKYMLNREESIDAAQEVFSAVYANIGSFGFKSKFSTWLYRLTVNHCINRLKQLKRRNSFFMEKHSAETGEPLELAEFVADNKKMTDEEMELKETGKIIINELGRFSETDRSIIILSDMEGLSCREIGKILDIPEGSVRSGASRTRRKLKEILEKKHKLKG